MLIFFRYFLIFAVFMIATAEMIAHGVPFSLWWLGYFVSVGVVIWPIWWLTGPYGPD